jgi:hypothetical protein
MALAKHGIRSSKDKVAFPGQVAQLVHPPTAVAGVLLVSWRRLAFNAVQNILQPVCPHQNLATPERRKLGGPCRRLRRHLFQQAVNGSPDQLAHRAILQPCGSSEPLNDRIRKQDLGFLQIFCTDPCYWPSQ